MVFADSALPLIPKSNVLLCFLFFHRYKNKNNKFKHLTNFSINCKAKEFISNINAEEDDYGNK